MGIRAVETRGTQLRDRSDWVRQRILAFFSDGGYDG